MTATLPRPFSSDAPRLARGRVFATEATIAHVQLPDRRLACRRATSCLVEPMSGDEVLVAAEDHDGWVISVLARGQKAPPLPLIVDGDVNLSVDGALRLEADTLDMVGRTRTRLLGHTLRIGARAAEVAIDRATVAGEQVELQVARLRSLAEQVDVVADRIVGRFRKRMQFVSELDQLRAQHVDARARGMMALRGEHTVLTAREVVKVDGEQVHVG